MRRSRSGTYCSGIRIGASTLICGVNSSVRATPPALSSMNRVLEHRLVELEPDFLDVARLLVAEQIAGAADVEVVAGELEAGAEAVEIGQHLQPLLRRLGDRAVGGHRQIGVGAGLRPARRGRAAGRAGRGRSGRSGGRSACWRSGCRARSRRSWSTAARHICGRRRRSSAPRPGSRSSGRAR